MVHTHTHTHTHALVPDISQLDERLVRLLAMQRVQELFTTETSQREDSASPGRTSDRLSTHTDPPKYLNGLKSMLLSKPVRPSFSPGRAILYGCDNKYI